MKLLDYVNSVYSGGQIVRLKPKVRSKGGLKGARIRGLEGGLEGSLEVGI